MREDQTSNQEGITSQERVKGVAISVSHVSDSADQFLRNFLHREGVLIGVKKLEDRWIANVEVVEEKRPFDDVVATYEITLDEKLNVMSFERKVVRKRSELPKAEPSANVLST